MVRLLAFAFCRSKIPIGERTHRAEISELVWGKISRARAVVGDSELELGSDYRRSVNFGKKKSPHPPGHHDRWRYNGKVMVSLLGKCKTN